MKTAAIHKHTARHSSLAQKHTDGTQLIVTMYAQHDSYYKEFTKICPGLYTYPEYTSRMILDILTSLIFIAPKSHYP